MAYRKLGRTCKHRRAMLANLTKDLIKNERIQTTETRAKEVRKCFDKMISYGKNGSLVSKIDGGINSYSLLKWAKQIYLL